MKDSDNRGTSNWQNRCIGSSKSITGNGASQVALAANPKRVGLYLSLTGSTRATVSLDDTPTSTGGHFALSVGLAPIHLTRESIGTSVCGQVNVFAAATATVEVTEVVEG